jgi:hypothetical protein
VLQITFPPESGGVAIAGKLSGDFEVGGLVLGGNPENQATSKDEGLRCRTGPHQSFEPSAIRFG